MITMVTMANCPSCRGTGVVITHTKTERGVTVTTRNCDCVRVEVIGGKSAVRMSWFDMEISG